ncbi:MAG: crossover junction endodeoxyribonuclease RuvC [Chitinophagales bacterium]|nr:crossover junction endodeoxyribonuclease RuvC [Chitinophagales bacterium]MCZ2394494.1 crossover junction endodeoxyribonuclease RuvC [Chitinophagales bacterium]
MAKKQIIIGIDPGTQVTGYGIISSNGQNAELVIVGSIFMEKFDDHYDRLACIYDRTLELIKEYRPDCLAIEAPFYSKNVQSMLKLGRAQGVAMAAALTHKLPVFEYAPKAIKQAITGNGNASKEQVADMLTHILKTRELPKQLDATDGLAAAVCHHFKLKMGITSSSVGSKNSWASFVKNNPNKIIQ